MSQARLLIGAKPLAIDEADGCRGLAGMCRLTKSASRTASAKSFVTRSKMIDRRRRRRIRPGASDDLHAVPSAAMRATARPIPPQPMIASVLPCRSRARGRGPRAAAMLARRATQVPRRGGDRAASRVRPPTDRARPACWCRADCAAVAVDLSMPSWPTPKRAITPPAGSAS